jgi:3'-phosphoadenosine 5'-phosphosulfate sulfotransferase (PAPS reductase)/FAD synthetase
MNSVELISRAPEVDALIDSGAPLIICVSGGKDSRLSAELAVEYARGRGHAGRVVLVYSDVNDDDITVTWHDAREQCEQLAKRLGVEFEVVRRKSGGLMKRLRARWRANAARYVALQCVTLIPPFATPKMRFCTSELKTAIIQRWIRQTFPGERVVCVLGVRRDESRSKKSGRGLAKVVKVYKPKDGKRPALPEGSVDWNTIVAVKTSYVLEWILSKSDSPSSYLFGAKRYSCVFCFMCTEHDQRAGLKDERNWPAYRAKCALEIESGFSYHGDRWLSDLAPELLTAKQRRDLKRAKEIAAARVRIEARIPEHLLFKNDGGLHGWPQTMPTPEEAELIASARLDVAALYGWEVLYTTGPEVSGQYSSLIEEKARRDARRGRVPPPPVAAPPQLSLFV